MLTYISISFMMCGWEVCLHLINVHFVSLISDKLTSLTKTGLFGSSFVLEGDYPLGGYDS